MVYPNPYKFPNGVEVGLRDTKGRYAKVSKAKYFYIYIDGELVLMDEFPRVNMRGGDKWELINLYVLEFLKDLETKELKEPEELEKELEEDLLEDVQAEDQEELAELLLEDFLKELRAYDKELYYELMEELRPPERLSFKKDKIKVDTIFSVTEGGLADIEKFFSTLKSPTKISGENLWTVKSYLENQLLGKFKKHYDNSTPGIDKFIPRITYNTFRKVNGRVVKELQGVSTGRLEITSWNDLKLFIIEDLIPTVMESFKKYLQASATNNIELTGLTLENMVTLT